MYFKIERSFEVRWTSNKGRTFRNNRSLKLFFGYYLVHEKPDLGIFKLYCHNRWRGTYFVFIPKPVMVVPSPGCIFWILYYDSLHNNHNVISEGETTRRLGVFKIILLTKEYNKKHLINYTQLVYSENQRMKRY